MNRFVQIFWDIYDKFCDNFLKNVMKKLQDIYFHTNKKYIICAGVLTLLCIVLLIYSLAPFYRLKSNHLICQDQNDNKTSHQTVEDAISTTNHLTNSLKANSSLLIWSWGYSSWLLHTRQNTFRQLGNLLEKRAVSQTQYVTLHNSFQRLGRLSSCVSVSCRNSTDKRLDSTRIAIESILNETINLFLDGSKIDPMNVKSRFLKERSTHLNIAESSMDSLLRSSFNLKDVMSTFGCDSVEMYHAFRDFNWLTLAGIVNEVLYQGVFNQCARGNNGAKDFPHSEAVSAQILSFFHSLINCKRRQVGIPDVNDWHTLLEEHKKLNTDKDLMECKTNLAKFKMNTSSHISFTNYMEKCEMLLNDEESLEARKCKTLMITIRAGLECCRLDRAITRKEEMRKRKEEEQRRKEAEEKERIRQDEEQRRKEAEEKERIRQAEEQRRKEAEEKEQRRQAEERRRKEAEEREQRKQAEELRRKEAEKREQIRQAKEQRRKEAEEKEQRRQAEKRRQKEAEEREQRRQAEELRRKEAEQERERQSFGVRVHFRRQNRMQENNRSTSTWWSNVFIVVVIVTFLSCCCGCCLNCCADQR